MTDVDSDVLEVKRTRVNIQFRFLVVQLMQDLKTGYCLNWQYVLTAFARWLYDSTHYQSTND